MEEPSTDPSDRERGPDEAFCRNCGAIISARAEICPECGVRQRPPPQSSLDRAADDLLGGGNPFVAAALSAVIPGLGQLYNRELSKGIALIVIAMVAALSTIIIVGIVLYPIVWVYAIYDAYKTAERQGSAADATAGSGRSGWDDAGRGGDLDADGDDVPDDGDDARDDGAAGRD